MSNIDKLAGLFKDRENPVHINITIGKVVSVDPFNIQYGKQIILTEKHLYFTHSLFTSNKLKIGDEVMMAPDNNLSNWYVIDKAVKL